MTRRYDPARAGTDALGLARGRLGLQVDAHLKTSLPHIYAAGDAAGNQQLTPTAAYEGRVAALNALQGDVQTVDYTVVPQAVFTTPEVARVGLTHAEALARGVRCHVARHDLRGASNGRATGEDAGYLKLVFDGASERVLGVQMVSYAAAELIQLAALAMDLTERLGVDHRLGREPGEDLQHPLVVIAELVHAGLGHDDDAHLLSSQLSIHPSHGERLIKIFGHDHHEVCEPA